MIDSLGWLGSLMLAVCAVPQAWSSWRLGHSKGLSSGMLWLWGMGDLLMLIDTIDKNYIPLIVNYGFNLVLITIIVRYKMFPRK